MATVSRSSGQKAILVDPREPVELGDSISRETLGLDVIDRLAYDHVKPCWGLNREKPSDSRLDKDRKVTVPEAAP